MSMAAMAIFSMMAEKRVVIAMAMRASAKEMTAGTGESVQIMMGVKSASLYRA